MSVLERPKNPNYGNVEDLCAELGFLSKKKCAWKSVNFQNENTPRREYSALHDMLLQHRDDPTTNLEPLSKLHLDRKCADSVEATEYVEVFLRVPAHQKLFAWTEEAEQREWPIYPADRQQIIHSLARITCQQEFFKRNNRCTRIQRAMAANTPTPFSTESPDMSEDEIIIEYQPPRFQTVTHLGLQKPTRLSSDRGSLTRNITIYVNSLYPLDNSPEVKSHDWLTKPAFNLRDVTAIDPFAIRYLHDNDVYQAGDQAKVNKFVADSISHYNLHVMNDIPDIDAQYPHLRGRCRDVIRTFVGSWMESESKGYGFLVQRGTTVLKSSEFETAWKTRRTAWSETILPSSMAQDRGRSTTQNVVSSRTAVSRKRELDSISVTNHPANNQTLEGAKRQRVANRSLGDGIPSSQSPGSTPSKEPANADMADRDRTIIVDTTREQPQPEVESSCQTYSSSLANNTVQVNEHSNLWPFLDVLNTTALPPHQPTDGDDSPHTTSIEASETPPITSSANPTCSYNTTGTVVEEVIDNGDSPPDQSSATSGPHTTAGSLRISTTNLHDTADNTRLFTTSPHATASSPGLSIINPHAISGSPGPSTITLLPTARIKPSHSSGASTQLSKSSIDKSSSLPDVGLDKRPSGLYHLSGSFPGSIEAPHLLNDSCSIVRISDPAEKAAPKKPRLRFAIEDANGMPDNDEQNLVLNKTMKGLCLASLFTFVCNRSGKSVLDAKQLTFSCQWGNRAALVVSSDSGEECWEKAKSKLGNLFKTDQRRFPEVRNFEVWVSHGGLENKLGTSESDDDDD